MAARRRPPSDSTRKSTTAGSALTPSVSVPAPGNTPVATQTSQGPMALRPSQASSDTATPRKSSAPRGRSTATAATAAGGQGTNEGTKSRKGTRNTPVSPKVSAEHRHAMIAEGAYLRAERRGFSGGDPSSDWLAAEREVDELLGADVSNSAQ